METDRHRATTLFERAARGEDLGSFLPLIYDELHRLAAIRMEKERADHTLQPTALVHEAFLRLIDQRQRWESRTAFFGLASEVMRRVLVDHARARGASKRGGDRVRVTLHDDAGPPDPGIDMLALDEALTALRSLHERQARVVELRFFGGLSIEGVASFLDVHRSTVTDDWAIARAWLGARLSAPVT